mgnify:CR=1 FL=1
MKKPIKWTLIVLTVISIALFFLLSWVIGSEGYRCDRIEYVGFPLNVLGLFC